MMGLRIDHLPSATNMPKRILTFGSYIKKMQACQNSTQQQGIEHAQGVWVYFVDGDDILAPDVIESFLAVLTAHEGDVEFIQGRMTSFVDGSNNFKP